MKNYKILWGIIGILLIIVVILSVVLGFFFTELNNAQQVVTSTEEEVSSLSEELETALRANDASNEDLNTCNSQLSAAKEKISSLEDEVITLEEEVIELDQSSQSTIADLEDQLSTTRLELLDLQRELDKSNNQLNKLMCSQNLVDQLNMDYSSIQSSSSRLQAFVANLPGVDHISWAFRNTLWNNADSKIHGVRYTADDGEVYSRQFLVFVKEFGLNEATFYVDDQCWLDPP